jgi:hypothetical protein
VATRSCGIENRNIKVTFQEKVDKNKISINFTYLFAFVFVWFPNINFLRRRLLSTTRDAALLWRPIFHLDISSAPVGRQSVISPHTGPNSHLFGHNSAKENKSAGANRSDISRQQAPKQQLNRPNTNNRNFAALCRFLIELNLTIKLEIFFENFHEFRAERGGGGEGGGKAERMIPDSGRHRP